MQTKFDIKARNTKADVANLLATSETGVGQLVEVVLLSPPRADGYFSADDIHEFNASPAGQVNIYGAVDARRWNFLSTGGTSLTSSGRQRGTYNGPCRILDMQTRQIVEFIFPGQIGPT